MTEQRMHIKDAKEFLARMEAELKSMGNQDKSGFLLFKIDQYKTAINQFEAQKNND